MGFSNKPFKDPIEHFKNRRESEEGKEERIKDRKEREFRKGSAAVEEARQKALDGE